MAALLLRRPCGFRPSALGARSSRTPGTICRAHDSKKSVDTPSALRATASQMISVAAAASLVMSSGAASGAPAVQMQSLADVSRPQFEILGKDMNRVLTLDAFKDISKQAAQEEDFVVPDDDQQRFAMQLFDLNQDGRLTVDEVLRCVALEGATSEDYIDVGVMKVFDRDGSGAVTREEFKAPFGPLAQDGEAMLDYVFSRVDWLKDNDGKLDNEAELGNAIDLMRVLVFGY